MEDIIIDCSGGLGNRLGSLVSGLEVAKLTNKTPVINWRPHNTCDCEFQDLFDSDFKISTTLTRDLLDEKYTVVSHQKALYGYTSVEPQDKTAVGKIKESTKPVVYMHDEIPNYLSTEKTILNLYKFLPTKTICNRVNNFINTNNINKNVTGIHIRKTDLNLVNEESYIPMVRDTNDRYFICSDSKSAEEKFFQYPNAITKNKSAYVEKLVDDKWRPKQFHDVNGDPGKYNVNRSKESVIEAYEDLLILSHTNLLRTSRKSSFLKFAFYYSYLPKSVCKETR